MAVGRELRAIWGLIGGSTSICLKIWSPVCLFSALSDFCSPSLQNYNSGDNWDSFLSVSGLLCKFLGLCVLSFKYLKVWLSFSALIHISLSTNRPSPLLLNKVSKSKQSRLAGRVACKQSLGRNLCVRFKLYL